MICRERRMDPITASLTHIESGRAQNAAVRCSIPMNRLRDKKDSTGALVTTRFKVVFLIGVILICVIIPTIAAELTYKEYARESETWRRGFLLGIAQYLSAVAQPDEEPPYHVRNAYQRCLSGATDSTLVRQLDSYVGRTGPSSAEPIIRIALRSIFELCRSEIEKVQSSKPLRSR
jgi:hypothetical protein